MKTKLNLMTKIKYTAVIIVSLYLLLGFFLIPYIVKTQAIKAINTSLQAQLQIQKAHFNPILFSLELDNVSLSKENQTLVSFEKLSVDFDLARTILNQYIHFKLLRVDAPVINIEVDKNNQMNLLTLLPKETKSTQAKEPKKQSNEELIHIQLDTFSIDMAQINYINKALNTPFKTHIEDFNLVLKDFNTRKEDVTGLTFGATIDKQAKLKAEGGIYLNPIKAYGNIDLNNYSPIAVWKSIQQDESIAFNEKLLVDTHIGYTVSLDKELTVHINDTMVDLKNFSLSQNQKKLVELKQLKLDKLQLLYPSKPKEKSLKADFSLFVNSGEIATKNAIDLEPLDVQSNFKVTQLPLDILNHILSQYVYLNINSAYLQSNGDLHIDAQKVIDFKSDTSIHQIALKKDKETLIQMSALNINSIQFNSKENRLDIKSIDINEPYSYVHINKKSELNLTQLAKPQPESKKEQKAPTVSNPIHITLGPVNVKNGSMTFEDETLPIPFKLDNKKLNGYFSHFNTQGTKPSDLKLEGEVGQYGYVLIKGLTTHNDIKNSTDIKLNFSNISIHDLTPYSGKFIGRKIDEGKLSLDLNYIIKHAKLEANNNIVIDKIKLGDKIESKDAVNLPLDLAIAILEDSNGIIDLSLPVKGDLDSPEFSIAPIVWKAFTNLITKALTAPFSLLGALFGFDEDEINAIVFNYGNSKITPVQKEPLDKLAQILSKRQKLAMKVTPLYNEVHDLYALQQQSFENKMNEKLKKVKDKDYEKEYLALLETTYESFDLSVKELKKSLTNKKELDVIAYQNALKDAIIKREVLAPEALNQLAKKRVNSIKEYLVKTKKINEAQIMIDEKISTVSNNEKAVELKLNVANIK